MKRIAILFLVCGLIGCCRSDKSAVPQVSKGHLDIYPAFASQHVPPRSIEVWTPADYDPSKRYDVLYMHDGQMLWDAGVAWNHQEWGIDEAMDSLIASGRIRPAIVVGIDNTPNRIGEYSPDDIRAYMPEGADIYAGIEEQGNAYLRFLVEELKPFIDSTYATCPDVSHTWVMGSSCGGLISSYALGQYPDVFGGAACLSTHCTLAYPDPGHQDSTVMAAYRMYLHEHLMPNQSRLYMDQGDQTLDAYYGETQAAINAMLRADGWDEEHFQYRFFPGAAHCEDDWQARLPVVLQFLLAK